MTPFIFGLLTGAAMTITVLTGLGLAIMGDDS